MANDDGERIEKISISYTMWLDKRVSNMNMIDWFWRCSKECV